MGRLFSFLQPTVRGENAVVHHHAAYTFHSCGNSHEPPRATCGWIAHHVELLKKDGIEEETDVFALYSSSICVAKGIKKTSGPIGQ